MQTTAIILLFVFISWFYWQGRRKRVKKTIFPESFRTILEEKVIFYKSLSEPSRLAFENRMTRFLDTVRITGVHTIVEEEDKVFVAASAIIPIFAFENWEYINLNEVLLYPNSFSEEFELKDGKEHPVLGMVGNGPMQQVMILSQPALRQGFINQTDKNNTAIHEFVHLIDKTDGSVDGIPENLLSKQYLLPWINMMHQMLKEIPEGNATGINPYGATSQGEFFAVISEYFFKRPDLLKYDHPELYELLEKIFRRDFNQSISR
ncbi:MAG: zinc-dependent peptidase [Ferruginibacter sp.]|nr:zinc-dependent peptidase [Ferruginibacter sp.]